MLATAYIAVRDAGAFRAHTGRGRPEEPGVELGLREANQHFSKAIRAVRAGQEVILTERGQPIAVIKPIKEEQALDATLERMAGEGLIALPARKGPMPSPRWRPIRLKGKPLSQTIVEDREDRF